jgi:hypothetical protein
VRSNNPIAVPVDDELVMADIDVGKYFGLSGVENNQLNRQH